jgi:anti-anti-sigma factor
MRLKIIRDDDSILHVALTGRLDVQGVNDIQYEFLNQTTSLPKSTLVELSHVQFMGSLGIGMLLTVAKTLERRGFKLVLLSPMPHVQQALEIADPHHAIPIASAETAALAMIR